MNPNAPGIDTETQEPKQTGAAEAPLSSGVTSQEKSEDEDSLSPVTSEAGQSNAKVRDVTTGAKVIRVNAVPDVDEILAAQKDRRLVRKYLSIGLGIMAFAFLLSLLLILISMFSHESMAIITHAPSAKGLTLISVSLGIFSAVGLSLMLALVRVSSDPPPKPDEETKGPLLTTTIVECCKAIGAGFRSLNKPN